ncbi:MAG: sugar phosphate isomerase/epimerase family protein [Lentimonas sp.]
MLVLRILSFICLALISAGQICSRSERVFFPFDNAFPKGTSVTQQVELLAELGYDGICSRPGKVTEELLTALEEHDLKLIASYVVLPAQSNAPLPEWLRQHIEFLNGSDTIIWLSLANPKASDKAAVEVIQKVYDLCDANGLELVLYGHVNFKTDTVATCARLREMAERPEVGLSFTLCHELRQNGSKGIEATLRSIASHLRLVQLNGANQSPTGALGWNDYIKPLGEGSLDINRVLRTLDALSYSGPVNLQCYKIERPPREHLQQSMDTWQHLNL